MNRVILTGNVGTIHELRTTQSGTPVINFSLATDEPRKTDNGYEDETEWHPIVAWDRRAENVAQVLQKGDLVTVEGRLRFRQVQGVRFKEARVHLDRFEIHHRPNGNGSGSESQSETEAASAES